MYTADRFVIQKTYEILVMLLHIFLCHCLCRSWDSVFSGLASLYAGRLRSSSLIFCRNKIFLVCKETRLALGPTQLPIEWVPGTVSLGVKWQEQGYDHTSPSNADIKNDWRCTSIPSWHARGGFTCYCVCRLR